MKPRMKASKIPSQQVIVSCEESLNFERKKFFLFAEIYCYDCKRYFVRGSGKFTRHVRETPCKPYQCHCGKLFKKKSSLKGHKSTHSLDEFPCQCGAIFRCEQYLKNHERRKHCVALKAKGSVTAAKRIFENIIVKPEQNTSETSLEESYFTPMNLLRLQMQD